MKQRTLAMMTGFERYTKKTKRVWFLEEIEQVVPWRELCWLIGPHYPKAGKGRPPVGVQQMLSIYFLQRWFNLSAAGQKRRCTTVRRLRGAWHERRTVAPRSSFGEESLSHERRNGDSLREILGA